jgi:hypothetical protein
VGVTSVVTPRIWVDPAAFDRISPEARSARPHHRWIQAQALVRAVWADASRTGDR